MESLEKKSLGVQTSKPRNIYYRYNMDMKRFKDWAEETNASHHSPITGYILTILQVEVCRNKTEVGETSAKYLYQSTKGLSLKQKKVNLVSC